jgi:hypothetical protein
MVSAAGSRVAAVVVLAAVDVTLAKVLRLGRPELRAASLAGALVGAADVVIEATLGALGVWRYDLACSILGTPVDLFLDVALVAMALCLGYAATARKALPWRAGYVVATTLVLGSWALFHNTIAVKQGIIHFAPSIDVGTAWFAIGNYALVATMTLGVIAAYHVMRRRS